MNRELVPCEGEENVLTSEELLLLQKLQQLAREGKEQVDAEVVALANQYLRWDYDDPASLVRAAYFMANDPFLNREVRTISAEFAAAESDGLEGG